MRESGYYRVKDKGANVWDIAYYEDGEKLWYLPRYKYGCYEDELEAIDENRIDPEPEMSKLTENQIKDLFRRR